MLIGHIDEETRQSVNPALEYVLSGHALSLEELMKKAMLLASLAATLMSGHAMALQTVPPVLRTLLVGQVIGGTPIGTAVITSLGTLPLTTPLDPLADPNGSCLYRMSWRAPTGFGTATPCILREQSVPGFSFGCDADALVNLPTMVTAGPAPFGPGFYCGGYDVNGTRYGGSPALPGSDGITLILGEAVPPAAASLMGVIFYPNLIFASAQSFFVTP
jgi:hypothetical protein